MFTKSFRLLNHKEYSSLWKANFITTTAIWMQTTASSMYMTHLSLSPLMNALVQSAVTLPMFIFAIPFSVIADFINRYKLLFYVQFAFTSLAVIYSFMVEISGSSSLNVLFFTFCLGIVSAMRIPTGQAMIANIVRIDEIKSAAILSNFGFNISRCLGPLLAAILYIYVRPQGVFLITGIMFAYVTYYFFKEHKYSKIPPTNFNYKEELINGFRCTFTTPVFKKVCLISGLFFGIAVSIWAILPYFVHYHLKENDFNQGLLISMIGIGALGTGLFIPYIKNLLEDKTIINICYLIVALTFLGLAFFHNILIISLILIPFGFAWATNVALLNGIIQTHFHNNVLSRAVSVYMSVMYVSQAIGSYIIGKLLTLFSIHETLLLMTVVLMITLLFIYKIEIC